MLSQPQYGSCSLCADWLLDRRAAEQQWRWSNFQHQLQGCGCCRQLLFEGPSACQAERATQFLLFFICALHFLLSFKSEWSTIDTAYNYCFQNDCTECFPDKLLKNCMLLLLLLLFSNQCLNE